MNTRIITTLKPSMLATKIMEKLSSKMLKFIWVVQEEFFAFTDCARSSNQNTFANTVNTNPGIIFFIRSLFF